MSLFTRFYKKLMTYSFFRNKAKTRLVKSVLNMDSAQSKQVSPGKRDWLNDAKKQVSVRFKPGIYRADLMLNNEVLPECKFYVTLELSSSGKFKCVRHFELDDILLVHQWDGGWTSKGSYLLLDSDFYFRETKVPYATRNEFTLKINPGTSGPNIKFKRLNKTELDSYKLRLSDTE